MGNPSDPIANTIPTERPSFREFLFFWNRLGWSSFGGPGAQISLLYSELVLRKKWASDSDFQSSLALCVLLPGPEALQVCILLGFRLFGIKGGWVAGFCFLYPALIVITILAFAYVNLLSVTHFANFLWGMKLGVAPLLLVSFGGLFLKVFRNLLPFQSPTRKDFSKTNLLISKKNKELWGSLGLGLLLLFFPFLLFSVFPMSAFWVQMYSFFLKTSFLTFGGAYAILPFVHHQFTNVFGWLTSEQVFDALALGETTPGPLVIVLSFLGFLASYSQVEPRIPIGLLGMGLASLATFLPSFLLVFGMAPALDHFQNTKIWKFLSLGIPFLVIFFFGSLVLSFFTQLFSTISLSEPKALFSLFWIVVGWLVLSFSNFSAFLWILVSGASGALATCIFFL